MGKWLLGILILAIVSLLLSIIGPWSATKHSAEMGNSINSALESNGAGFATATMSGNVATLTGEAPNEDAAFKAVGIAKNAKCEACKDRDDRWHVVESKLDIKKAPPPPPKPTIPTQSPYTFDAVKLENGMVVLDGYVRNESQKRVVLAHASDLFGSDKVSDNKIKIANGAPNGQWEKIITTNIDELYLLDKGRLTMENDQTLLSGVAATEDIRDQINAMVSALPGRYNGAANISVPDKADNTAGEVKSEGICQKLFDELNQGKTINFSSAKAEIRGAASFDLLNSLASAAKQCASFRIKVDGHTDSDGPADANQWLSDARASTVVAYLADNGVETDRMTAKGYGESQPVASNDNAEGKAQNRRIEFTVTQSN